jgi:hypothetical protein
MAFSKQQRTTAWLCFAGMAAMLLYPPWFWQGTPDEGISSRQFGAGYAWLWQPPACPPEYRWSTVVWWDRLLEQWTIVAVGMVLLLFLREARERGKRA